MPRKQKPKKNNLSGAGLQLAGVGIDLVDLSRMKQFLSSHGRRAYARLLHPSEKSRYFSSSHSAVKLAQFFAAKEAYFKASGASWLGVDGFKDIEVRAFPKGRFEVKSSRFTRVDCQGAGSFFRQGRWVGAQVILWKTKHKK